MQNYLKKSEQKQLVKLTKECLVIANAKNDEESKNRLTKILEILETKNIFKECGKQSV